MTTSRPLRHLSIRVPWHDSEWDGTICSDPVNNASCLRLRNIHARRDDELESRLSGKRIDNLEPQQHPPCVAERATFMAGFPIIRHIQHPYAKTSDVHKHYIPTPLHLPPWSAGAVPFRWLLREQAPQIADSNDLLYHDEPEEEIRALMGFDSSWVQDADNQRRLLDGFISAVEPETSLAFFYAKEVPLTEEPGRVLVGVARVTGYGDVIEYDYRSDEDRPTRSMIWERPVQHSLRAESVAGGFLLPYHAALARASEDPSFDPASLVVFAPDEAFDRFSYGAEHVTHDQAIAALLAMIEGLRRAEEALGSNHSSEIRWAQDRLAELWKLRGPYPGLGAALDAFGLDHPHLLAFRILERLDEREDPWPAVQAALDNPGSIGSEWVGRLGPTAAKKLAKLPDERGALLHLLARFELTGAQAKRMYVAEERAKSGIEVTDAELLANPYLLYEADRLSVDRIPVAVIDRGLFPDPGVSAAFPLPEPSAMSEPQDPRRVRALMVSVLESATGSGHTLRAQDEIVLDVRELAIQPSCPIDSDLLAVIGEDLEPTIRPAQLADGQPAFQLDRLALAKERISETVRRRAMAGKRHVVEADWVKVLEGRLGSYDPADAAEARAREEKAAALAEVAAARVSVLVGPAGTGKTTLLTALCEQPAIQDAGVTLLAPTGKARVQLERGLGAAAKIPARTIAQFLLPAGRYDPATGAYSRSSEPPRVTGGTVIIDEASMLTEEQLDAVLDNVRQVDRLILVGDPRQLPPIGAGRPFVDIVEHLLQNLSTAFPRVGPSYAELTVLRRQREEAESEVSRHDLALAQWFGGEAPSAEAEEVWGHVLAGGSSSTLRFEQWDQPIEVFDLLKRVLAEEVAEISDEEDQAGFGASLGGSVSADYVYYNQSTDRFGNGAGVACEAWQVLSPIRATGAGVTELNRAIHRHFRADHIEQSINVRGWMRRVPKPMGPEGIVYGDKVMNIRNHRHKDVWPEEFPESSTLPPPLKFVANGEIGMVVGQFKRKGQKFKVRKLEVEFSTQSGAKYGFGKGYVPTEGDPILELAYAITVHKAQGSEFGTTFLIIPNPCRLLSRELLYTALTRQTKRVVVLHQGPLSELLSYGSVGNSETARRYTNLFKDPQPVDIGGGRYLEDRLIHRTADGTLVRSKSEVIIADALHAAGVQFSYETPFTGHDGTIRLPDFTIEDADTGEAYIWEHLGMLSNPDYARAWERKRAWYATSGVKETGGDVTLIVTSDDERGGIDSGEVHKTVTRLFGSA
jgi:hypothetical protein